MAHTYNQFLVRTVNGKGVVMGVEELLRTLLSGYLPDGTSFDGINIAGTVTVGSVSLAAGSATIGGVTDQGAGWTSVFGVSGARFTSADQSGSAANVTDAPDSGEKLVITDILVAVDTAMRVDFKEETSGTVVASTYMAANSFQQITPRSKLKLATADKKLQVQTSASGNIAVTAFYHSES
jgi:hypothetical protein